MKTKLGILLFLSINIQCKKLDNLDTLKSSKVIEYHYGNKIEDTYRNLENLEDSSILKWLKIQQKKSQQILNSNLGISKISESIKNNRSKDEVKITQLKITNDDYYFYLKRKNSESIGKLYFRKGFSSHETLLYDPKKFDSLSNKKYLINYIQPSWDSKKIAIGITINDQEYSSLFVLDVKSRKVISETIKNVLPNSLGGIEWLPDNEGFMYTHTPVVNPRDKDYGLNRKMKIYHLTKDLKDVNNFFSDKIAPGDSPIAYFTDKNNPFVLAAIINVNSYRDTYYEKIENISGKKLTWKKLYSKDEKIRQFFLFGNDFYYRTAKDASNFKICKTDLRNFNFTDPELLVDETKDAVISDFCVTKDGIYFVKTKNGVEAKLYYQNHTDKKITKIELPKPSGHINLYSKGRNFSDIWLTIEGWTSHEETYLFNLNDKAFIPRNLAPVIKYNFLSNVIVEEIEIPSHDGVMVPLSIVYQKGTKLNRQNRMLINAYGAYKWSNSPYLYNYLLYWLEEGGVYATAHVRGGGEKGNDWHLDGYKTTKPNSWKDLIACTEYLIDKKYTNKDKIALWGASAGGITIGRAITERPDLFKTAFIRAGVLNPLRREFGPNGESNTKEYGTIKDSIEFKALLEMDAYHHIKKDIQYPSIYFTAGINDSRVPPWQPAKFVAKLLYETDSESPILFDTDFEGGHGFEISPDKKDEELAKIMTFLLWQTGHSDYQPKN